MSSRNPWSHASASSAAAAPVRPTLAMAFKHPVHALALGFGSGLSPWAPGTVGTALAWVLYALAEPWLGDAGAAFIIAASLPIGVVACAHCARTLRTADPSAIVWDEFVAFWIVLWFISPASWKEQVIAFVVFRFFDAVKFGPVAWADRWGKPDVPGVIGLKQGVGIMLDDLVAAALTLLVMVLLYRAGLSAWLAT